MLFHNICEGQLIFPEEHWQNISVLARRLICQLLTKDSSARLTADQVLSDPWVSGGTSNTNTPLATPTNLRRQASIKQLEDFASRAMAVNRAVQKSETWGARDVSNTTTTSARQPRHHLWDVKINKCFSINELHSLDVDTLAMKAIV